MATYRWFIASMPESLGDRITSKWPASPEFLDRSNSNIVKNLEHENMLINIITLVLVIS